MKLSWASFAGWVIGAMLCAAFMHVWLTIFPARSEPSCIQGYALSRHLVGPDICVPGYRLP